MLLVGNSIPIMTNVREVVELLSRQLHIEGIALLGTINYPKYAEQDIMCSCISHKGGQERKPSMGIMTRPDKSSGKIFVHCLACGYKATLETFISNCFGIHDRGEFGLKWLLRNFNSFDIVDRSKFFSMPQRKAKNVETPAYIGEDQLSAYRWYHPYMYKRHLTDDLIEQFDIGFNRGTNSLTFPVRDLTGNVVFVAERSVSTKRFHYPVGTRKPIYGLYESNKLFNSNNLYVCESFLNALMFIKWGKPAVALMGTGDAYQYELLKKSKYRHIVICTDNDDAGNVGALKLKRALNKYKFVSRLKTKKGTDINDWGYLKSFEEFLEKAVDKQVS